MSRHNDPPYFPFYPDDFASDGKVEAMTTEEVGAYTLLLCKAWREDPPGSIPDDDRVLARWTRLAPDRWTECRAGVLAAFALGTDSRWHQKRMRREYEKFRVLKQKRIESARYAAHARYERKDASRMRGACESEAQRIRGGCLSYSYSYSDTEKTKDISVDSVEQLFGEFWEAYPRKEVPNKARRAFEKLKPDRKQLITILDWLRKAKLSTQWQCVEFIPQPATFLSQRYWEGDPPPAVAGNQDLVGLSCAEAASGYSCDLCEGTDRLVVVFSKDNGNSGKAIGCAPWPPIREKLMASKGEEAHLFRCGCESGQDYSQLEIWVPETHSQGFG